MNGFISRFLLQEDDMLNTMSDVVTWTPEEEMGNSRSPQMEHYLDKARQFIKPIEVKSGFQNVYDLGEEFMIMILPTPDEQSIIERVRRRVVLVRHEPPISVALSPDQCSHLLSSTESEESQRARLQQELCSPLLTRLKTWRNTAEEDRPPDIDWPTEAAFEEADQFIRKLPLSSLSLLDMDIAEDGEINFLWDTDTIEIDLGFYGSRPCSYFARDKRTGRKMRGSGFDPEKGLPDELEALFTQ